MKTEDVMRFEAELRAMRAALGTPLVVNVLASEAGLAESPATTRPRGHCTGSG